MRGFQYKYCWLLLIVLLGGCGESVELHRQLSEQEANEVIAELENKQIRAQKVPAKDGVVVRVEAKDIGRAVRTLEAVGLPRHARSTLGDIFRKEGVISTPLEERARYIYALSQELEYTLTNIDGVIVARVHVVLPERIAPGEPVQPASASVFIKHDPRLEPDSIQPRVRRMVASGIPGMATAVDNPQKLTVVFVPAAAYQEEKALTHIGPFLIASEDASFWRNVLVLLIILPLLAVVGALFWFKRRSVAAPTAGEIRYPEASWPSPSAYERPENPRP
ncbi:type III secretion inner membrane ring lipoprotein SctJ [Pseudomonas sp. 15FMM2]|uniref:Type III secretion inner membrane ring lipoprotein SctJ n=1 Tax=Pseudomonas imrae TaxID=2992837 RepID=A0ACC7PAE3_9PSED